ncbi:hypothetical protein BJY00DRAFT_43638 [Aspergillus carlsbadensis]|nr:hypothetical protein BJY00DRAFT_43638 [Aspergillus carlsbadensis]
MLERFKKALGRRSKENPPPHLAAPTTSSVSDPANTKNGSDHWEIAYDQLSDTEQTSLSRLLSTTPTQSDDSRSRTKEILTQVLEVAEKQYEEYQQGRTAIRATAHKILNSTLSFQDIISNVVRIDPTGHASSAWAIVSLGLTMAKNHADLRGALFESSAYLADVLTRSAFIEQRMYSGKDSIPNAEKDRSLVRVYVAILRYAAEVCRIQRSGTGRDLMESMTAITSQPLTHLKSSIKEEESQLQLWLLIDQHLHRKAEAEAILAGIDEVKVAVQEVGKAVAMLNLPFADGAFFDSFSDQHEDECLPRTRVELLQQIEAWASLGDRNLFWLSGMAGTGKSTIARTAARLFKEQGILGASFFFKRSEGDRGSAARFIPTIVKQLAAHIPEMIPGIRKALEDDPTIPAKSLREQFDKLLLKPLLAACPTKAGAPIVIVIDALDECEREEEVEVLLELLPKAQKVVRFFVAARPDPAIRFGFAQMNLREYQSTVLQDLDNDVIKQDITLYLREEFYKISQRRDLGPDWPGKRVIEALTSMAVPLFIFAATVCRFVADRKFNPEKRLQQFLTEPSGSKMDRTYRPVLNQLLTDDESDMEQLVEQFHEIIGVIILLAHPLSLSALAQLLAIPEEDISTHLDSFHSVLSIPDNPQLPIRTLHLSFHDYLVDERTRAHEATSRFWVNKPGKHGWVANQCLATMNRSLQKNICRLPSYGTSRDEIDPAVIASSLPVALQYACRYWAYHLSQGTTPIRNLDKVLQFLKKHFLHWLEAMGILGLMSETISAVTTMLGLLDAIPNDETFLFLSDAKRFILKNAHIAARAPLQLYCSGLIFAPRHARTRTLFANDIPQWIPRLPDVEDNWSPELQTLEGQSSSISCVKFSPDGKTIASASCDGTINIWSTTGTLERTLDGHQADQEILDLAFSPDGNTIISASEDGTVNLWSSTGDLRKTLCLRDEKTVDTCFSPDGRAVDASYYVREVSSNSLAISDLIPKDGLRRDDRFPTSILFSPNGELIVTGCSDGTIQLWDCHGNLQHSLKGHNDSVNSVAISPDGNTIASGSADWTIKLWDTITGTMRVTTMGHPGEVKSVIFSPNGRFIASFSDYALGGTAKVWDKTGTLKHTLGGHENGVSSVAFSPNGALTAMGFSNGTVSVWETDTWTLHCRLEGGSSPAELAFSSDGKQLAAGCWSNVINVWQLNTGTLQCTLRGHSSAVNCIAFSPDGRLIASGAGDHTVKIWDASAGASSECDENAHTGEVSRLEVSPNGKQVASIAPDDTIRLWNADTGDLQHVLSLDGIGIGAFLYSPDSTLLLFAAGYATGLKVWNPTTGALVHSASPSDIPDKLESAQFSPDGKAIVYHTGKTFDFRDTVSQELLHSVEATRNLFFCAKFVFSPSSALVAIYSAFPYTTPRNKEEETKEREKKDLKTLTTWRGDRKIAIHNSKTGTIQSVICGHPDLARIVKFSPNDHFVASVSFDGTVRLWKAATGELEHCLQHTRPVAAVAFTQDTKTLASLSVRDNTIKIWSTASGTLQYTLPSVDELEDLLSFSEDSKFLTTNRGSIDIEASRAKGTCVLRHDSVSVEDGEWIYFGCHKVLWLPHEYRGVTAVRDGRVIIGRTTGSLTFMDFVCGSDGVPYVPA